MLKGLVAALLLGLASLAAASSANKALVVVVEAPPGLAARLQDEGVTILRDMDRFLIVAAGPREIARLEELGIEHEIADVSMDTKTFYTVSVRDAKGLAAVSTAVRVLYSDGIDALVRAEPEEAEALAAVGFEIARVFTDPARVRSAEEAPRAAKRLTADPLVQEMVDSVSIAEVSAVVQRLQDFRTRYCRHDSCAAAASWIQAKFESFGIDSVYFHWFDPDIKHNVVAVIPGVKDPDKIVLVGGHYDSITGNHNYCPGADDDASGTALVIECARILSRYTFNHTLVFVAFGGEEVGLVGSEAFAARAAHDGDDVIGVVCADMIGYVAPGDAIDLDIVKNVASTWMRDLVMDVGSVYVPELSIVDGAIPGGASSDHASFWRHGYDAILFFEDSNQYSPYIHTSNDRIGISYISEALAERSVRAAVGLLATMAEPFDIAIEHVPLAHTEDSENPHRVLATITASGSLNPDSLLVRYRTSSAWSDLVLTPAAGPNEYEAFIPPQPSGTFVDYYLVAGDMDGDRLVVPKGAPESVHTFFVGTITPIVVDGLEEESGWIVGDADDDATKGIWERAAPNGTWWPNGPVAPDEDHTPDPGTMCFVTGNAPPGSTQRANEVQGGKTTLFSPVYDLSSYPNVRVRYYRWYSNNTGFLDPDEWVVDVSSDSGVSWVRIETDGKSDQRWQFVERNLSDFIPLTSEVRFRFIASDEGYMSVIEAGVDDFSLVTYEEVETEIASDAPRAASRAVLARNVPNPFNPSTRIAYTIPEGAGALPVSLRVYDLSGRLVRVLVDGPEGPGARAVTWNGFDERGRSVSSGVYFYRLRWNGQEETKRMVLLR
ncbi:MAG: M20/M25/M40 family metallo-hydrolase [Candidatus Eisenbacteria bacterium]|nr:M20/M25/M40 family metallo-hydrolase [Candidatus Eisenbacteria bacterium]